MAWNFLDLHNVFVNEVSGTAYIFIFLALIAIFYFATQFRMPNGAVIMLSVLFLLMMGFIWPVLLPFVLLGIGVFVGWQVVRVINR